MMNVTNPINSAKSLNFINSFNAKNAFSAKEKVEETKVEEKEDLGLGHVNNSILNKIDVADVQKYATSLGEKILSEDELKYGLIFGRSVLMSVLA